MKTRLSLKTDGVTMVNYPETTKTDVAEAAESWKGFLQLPQDVKDTFTAVDLQSGVGYERKGNGERESRDIKENFDITKSNLAELSLKASEIPEAESFIEATRTLFESIEQMAIQFGKHVESTYDVHGFADETQTSADAAFVRFLYYPPVPLGVVIGEPHVDHSGFTFHLYESTDGCDRLSFDKETWLPMPVEEGKAAVFGSMQTQLLSGGEIKGLCHKITANKTTTHMGRIAIVCFIPLINTPVYDRKTHGRLQEMTPGFNYTMNQEMFTQLFKTSQSADL